MVAETETNGRVGSRGRPGLGSLIVIVIAAVGGGAVWLSSLGDGADHRMALLTIGVGGLGWATTMTARLSSWPEPVATRALVGASTAGMLTVLAGVAALLVGAAS